MMLKNVLKSKIKNSMTCMHIVNSILRKNKQSKKEVFKIESKGKLNKDKMIYYIDVKGGFAGFFSLYRLVLNLLYVADRFGFSPYVSVTDTHYTQGEDNLYDMFFVQSNNYELPIERSYNIVRSNPDHARWIEDIYLKDKILVGGYEVNEKYIRRVAKIKSKYVRMKPDIKSQIENDIRELIGDGEECIAVQYRGNAYNVGFYGHPMPIHIEDYYEYIDECLESGYKRIFIATDEEEALRKLTARYTDRVIFYQDVFRSNNGIDVHEQINTREQNGYLMGYEVMRDMMTLANCGALICGNTQVTISAQIEKISMNKEFKYKRIIDKGFYKKDNFRNINKYYMLNRKKG